MSFSAHHVVPARREDVWAWHTRQGALTRLNAPFAFMRPLQQATDLGKGTSIWAFLAACSGKLNTCFRATRRVIPLAINASIPHCAR